MVDGKQGPVEWVRAGIGATEAFDFHHAKVGDYCLTVGLLANGSGAWSLMTKNGHTVKRSMRSDHRGVSRAKLYLQALLRRVEAEEAPKEVA